MVSSSTRSYWSTRTQGNGSKDLIIQLLVAHFLDLRLLFAQEAREPSICIPAHDYAGADGGFSPSDHAALDLLDLAVEGLQHIFLALNALGDGEAEQALALGVELSGGLLDDGEAGFERGEGGVAEGVGTRDVG